MPARHWTNQEIAHLFRNIAASYELKSGDVFRIKAYENAAESIDHLGSSLRDLWEQGKLDEVAGLGESLQEHLDELFRTGRVKHFDEVMEDLPKGMFALMDLPDVGPKKALKIAKKLKLNKEDSALKQLSVAIEKKKFQPMERIGSKTISQLQRALQDRRESPQTNRLFLPDAEAIAEDVMVYLRKSPTVLDVEALGSLRRHNSTVGDVDIAVQTRDADAVFSHLKHFPNLKRFISAGENTAMFLHSTGRQVDVKTHVPQEWGSMLQHYTGSKAHNIHLRTLAKEKGLSLSEYGIKTDKGLKRFESEETFYKFLGMQYVPAELREDSGEIEAAVRGALPHLVELRDIRGDLHIHTNLDWPTSHDSGNVPLDQLFSAAVEFGYEYIGLSDHQPKASGLSPADRRRFIERRNEKIDRALEKWKNKSPDNRLVVFKGLEVDIKPDGNLALEDESLNQLDYAIVSVHSEFAQSKHNATKRVLKALSHPKATIWGHPTGRMLGTRRGLEYDWNEIFAFCAKRKTIIEINASPWRLDLSDALIHQAVEKGIRMIINSDTHAKEHLDFMKYGVWTARRGWAEKKDIVNTFSAAEMKRILP